MDLSTSDLIEIIIAARSDDDTLKRIDAIRAEQKKLEEQLESLARAQQTNQQVMNEALAARRDAVDLVAAQAVRASELDAREKNIGEVQAAIMAEKVAWEEIRQRVDAEQKAEAQRLGVWEKSFSEHRNAVETREKAIVAREKAQAERSMMLDEIYADLVAVLTKHGFVSVGDTEG